MIAALRALRTNKTIVILSVCTLILGSALFWAYSKAKSHSYAKLEPYALSFTIQQSFEPSENLAGRTLTDSTAQSKNTDSIITMAYDYGYGITKNHKRKLTLEPTEAEKTFNLSLSSWKQLRGLHFIGRKNTNYRLINLTISKADNIYKLSSEGLTPIINESNNITYNLPLGAWTH